PRYHGCYDGRPLNPGKLEEMEEMVRETPWKPELLVRLHQRLYGEDLKHRMKDHQLLRDDYDMLQAIKRNQATDDETFRFRGRRYEVGEVNRLIKQVQRELDEDFEWLGELDRRVFRVYYQMAIEVGNDEADDLLYRYEFHLAVQAIDRDVSGQRPPLEAA